MESDPTHIIHEFQSCASRLAAALANQPEEYLDWRPDRGEWSIRQIVHHLADDLDVWSMCIKKAVATPGAVVRFEGFPGNQAWADALQFDQRPVQAQLDLIQAHRLSVTELALHFEGAWDRSMQIADSSGEVRATLSVADILKMLTDHMNEHLRTIEQILARAHALAGDEE
jgi:uncharacterized damage-inducible protein DinB